MARGSRPLLHNVLIVDTLKLLDLMDHASQSKTGHKWISATLTKASRTDLSLSDHYIDRSRPRRRDDP